jgi:lipopolysaccharide export system protein LptA
MRQPSTSWRLRPAFAALVIAVFGAAASAQPQPAGPPNALQGFSQNRDQPVKINAATLEVRDRNKVATFSGNVHLVQGDTTLRCKILVVFYDQDDAGGPAGPAGPTVKSSTPGPSGSQQIRRMEAKGGVIVTQKDQTATGDSAIYDLKSNTVTLVAPAGGSVAVTQGPNVMKGESLVVDLTTSVSHLRGGAKGVEGLIIPSSTKGDKTDNRAASDTKAAPKPAPKDAPKQRQPQPSSLY